MSFIKEKTLRLVIKKFLLRKNKVQNFESTLKNRGYPAVRKYHYEVALPTALQQRKNLHLKDYKLIIIMGKWHLMPNQKH